MHIYNAQDTSCAQRSSLQKTPHITLTLKRSDSICIMSQAELPDDTYFLRRDSISSLRLTAQHSLFVKRAGGLLHPDILADLQERKSLAIADVACGNGIWAIEIAEQHPNAMVFGLDNSTVQFAPEWTWPHNTVLKTYDLFCPVPDHYVERFDVVHIRLMVGNLYDKDKDVVIDNLLRMVKPGGWLQWSSPLPASEEFISFPSSLSRTSP